MSRTQRPHVFARTRSVALSVTVTLIAGLVASLGPAGSFDVAEAATATSAIVAALPSMSAAMRAAQNQGQRVEVLSMHTTQSRTWANPDGTVTVDSYAGPEWVQRGDGSWDVVDTTLSVRPDLHYGLALGPLYFLANAFNPCANRFEREAGFKNGNYRQCLK